MSDDGAKATMADFEKLDIRIGKVVEVTPFPAGKYSTHILLICTLGHCAPRCY